MHISKNAVVSLHTLMIISILLLSRYAQCMLLRLFSNDEASWQIDANIAIIGDSHAMCGIDENQFHKAVNLSLSSENSVYSFYKLRRLLQTNHQIDTVILSVASHSFGKQGIDGQSEFMKRYGTILESALIHESRYYKDYNVVSPTFIVSRTLLPIGLLYECFEYFRISKWSGRPNWIGQQELSRKSKIGDKRLLHAAVSRHFFDNNKPKELSSMREIYYDRIVSLCREHKVKLFLVTTAVHPEYLKEVPYQYSANLQKIAEKHKEYATYYDLNAEVSHFNDNDFRDYDHLTISGAIKTSEFIKSKLEVN